MAEFNADWLSGVPQPPSDDSQFIGQLEDPTYRAGLDRLEQSGQYALRDIWYWTNRLNSALPQLRDQLEAIRYTSRVTVGFIEELEGRFGIVVYTESPQAEPSAEPPEADAPRSPEPAYVAVDGREFPVVVRDTYLERQWCTAPQLTDPSTARATCWVRSPSRRYEGWLIPRHAVRPLRARVRFSDGGEGTLLDHFGECIDSVVVSSTRRPSGLSQARACWPLFAGRPLEVTDAPHGHVPIRVLQVDMNLGVLSEVTFPVRFSTDWTGVAGQSGSLIIDPNTGEPAGSYLGITHAAVTGYVPPGMSAAPTSAGYAQSCFQLEKIAGMEFFI
jgi:hypothetical protein